MEINRSRSPALFEWLTLVLVMYYQAKYWVFQM